MTIEPVAFFRSPFTSKFGIPRQSGLVASLKGVVELTGKYCVPESLRGLEEYDYLWLVWGFSENVGSTKHPTVRPPLLGGNKRVGVWATRSSFRPNNLGLSSVRIDSVDDRRGRIVVLGADLMDGTPIYDIKPYLPYVDSHPGASGGFTDSSEWQLLEVVVPDSVASVIGSEACRTLREILTQDPRPHYHADASREYVMPFMQWEIAFRVDGRTLTVISASS